MVKYFGFVKNSDTRRRDSQDFKTVLKRHTDLRKYFDTVKLGVEPARVSYKGVDFLQFHSLFFVGVNPSNEQKAATLFGEQNPLYMALIADSFAVASEAYSTIGPLEFFKFEKAFLRKKSFLGCVSAVEVFLDNFSMILGHLGGMENLRTLDLANHQSVSDVFGKYLRRAMRLFGLKCLNLYGVQVDFFRAVPIPPRLFDHWVWRFYDDIAKVSGPDKKARYFEMLKARVPDSSMEVVFEEIFAFYLDLAGVVFKEMPFEDLLLKEAKTLI